MEVILGKTAGFCPGVANTVIKAEKQLKENGTTYCLGELIHNEQEVQRLEKIGLKIINSIQEVPNGSKLILRAHGTSKNIYEIAKQRNIEIIDLTCPKVLEIHKKIEKYKSENYFIILIGEKEHPEVVASYSFCGEKAIIIECNNQIEDAIEQINKTNSDKVLVISQTTFSMEKFDNIVESLKEKVDSNVELEIQKTICDATQKRQQETKEIASKVELMLIIGGKHSSNTNKLYEIAKQECNNAMLVETKKEVYMNYVQRFKKVGIMAGASTPKNIIDEITEMVSKAEVKGYIESKW